MHALAEASDVTETDRLQCRALIEAAGFHAVDYEDDGACWERMLWGGDCLVLEVWETGLYGKPERREWTVARFMRDGLLAGCSGPMTLQDALACVAALARSNAYARQALS